MSFNYAAGTITQTGTDANLSGLVGLTGVTTFVDGYVTVYVIDAVTVLEITGTLSWLPKNERLIILNGGDGGNDAAFMIEGGDVTIGEIESTNPDGSNRYSTGVALVLRGQYASQNAGGSGVNAGGSLTMYGCEFQCAHVLEVRNGSSQCFETILKNINPIIPLQAFRSQGVAAAAVQYTDVVLDGVDFEAVVFSFDGYTVFSGQFRNSFIQPRSGAFGGPMLLENLSVEKNGSTSGDFEFFVVNSNPALTQPTEITNVDVGSGIRYFNEDKVDARGYMTVFQKFSAKVSGTDGLPIESCVVRLDSANNGQRRDILTPEARNSRTFIGTDYNTYLSQTDALGNSSEEKVLLACFSLDDQSGFAIADDLYSKTNTRGVDDYDINFASYGHNLARASVVLHASSTMLIEQTLSVDSSISEFDPAVVASYTDVDAATKFYDAAELYLVDPLIYVDEQSTIVSRSGDIIDAGSYDVVFDSGAAQNINLSGNTLTVKTSSYSDGITTTGTVTSANGADISLALITSSAGFNTKIVIDDLTNSNVQIINSSNVVIERQTGVTGTFEYATDVGVSGAHKIVINREGYAPLTFAVNFDGGVKVFSGSLLQDKTPDGSPMYSGTTSVVMTVDATVDGSSMRADIANGSVTAQTFYDVTETALMTSDGMTYIANGGGRCTFASLPTGTFLFLGDNYQARRASPTDSSATISAFVTSTQGTIVDSSNGDVQFVTVTAAQQLTEYGGFVWVDLISGVNGNQYPAGTPLMKVDSVSNAIMVAQNYGLNRIKVSGQSTTLSQELVGYEISSDTSTSAGAVLIPTLTLSAINGADNCKFDGFIIEGATDVSTLVFGNEYEDCVINGLTGLTGVVRSSKLAGIISVEHNVDVIDCYGTSVLNITGSDVSVSIPNYSGQLTIAGMSNANDTVSIGVLSGVVVIDNSCTAGEIIVANADQVVGTGAGVTITIINDTTGGGGGGDDAATIYTYFTEGVRANEFKADVSLLASQSSVDAIPTNTVLTADARLDNLDAAVSSRSTSANVDAARDAILTEGGLSWATAMVSNLATQASVNLIPTNPLLSTDARLDNLDVKISTRSAFDAASDQVVVSTNNDKAGYSLANNSITSSVIANNALNNQAFTTGYFNAINSEVVTAISSEELATTSEVMGARDDILSEGALSWTTADVSGLATQSSVNLIPIDPLLTDDLRLDRLDVTVSSRSTFNPTTDEVVTDSASRVASQADISTLATQSSVNSIPVNPLLAGDTRLDYLDASISSRASEANLTSVRVLVEGLPSSGDISQVQSSLDLLEKYHDNQTRFLAADGSTEVVQSESFFMAVLDNDSVTELKRIAFRNSLGAPANITEATRYVKL